MRKGFTLIELMVVVAIIAVLTGIVLTQFSTAKAKSRDVKRVSDLGQIQLAIQLYFDRCGQYPGIVSNKININSAAGTCSSGIKLSSFIRAIPKGPSGFGTEYDYKYIIHTTAGVIDDYYLGAKLEQPSRALDDDIDIFPQNESVALIVGVDPGWTGESINADDGQNMYVIGAK